MFVRRDFNKVNNSVLQYRRRCSTANLLRGELFPVTDNKVSQKGGNMIRRDFHSFITRNFDEILYWGVFFFSQGALITWDKKKTLLGIMACIGWQFREKETQIYSSNCVIRKSSKCDGFVVFLCF
jgi:hypothetical protein